MLQQRLRQHHTRRHHQRARARPRARPVRRAALPEQQSQDEAQPASPKQERPHWLTAVAGAAASATCVVALLLSPLQGGVAQGVEQAPAACASSPQPVVGELAGLFSGDEDEERDPIDAFTLYGTTFKRFVIEVLDGEKIVSRRKGFTVETCVASALANQQMPSFQFLPLRDKVGATGNAICTHAEGARLPPTCYESCAKACQQGLDKWAVSNEARTGFSLLAKDATRMVQACTRECTIDCQKPGKAYDFSIPYRK